MWDRPELLNPLANALYALAFLLVLYGGFLVVVQLPTFPLREVQFAAAPRAVTYEQIEQVVRAELSGTFFTLDLARTRRAFEALPWVRKADVRRKWPDRLEVSLEEHVPLARWGSIALVNVHGEVFSAPYEGRLPVFHGPAGSAKEMAIQYAYFRRSLETIGMEPVQVSLSPRRAWSIRLDTGLTLELGRDDVEQRLARFVRNYRSVAELLARRIDHVDLRYADGFAVRVPGLARLEAKDRAK